MKKLFDVHVYAVVRVKVRGISAENQIAAIASALDRVDYHSLFLLPNEQGVQTEFAEDFSDYLVDEVGDEEYRRSVSYRDMCHLEGLLLNRDKTYR